LGRDEARELLAQLPWVLRELDDVFVANTTALEVEAELVGALGAPGAGETDGVGQIAECGPQVVLCRVVASGECGDGPAEASSAEGERGEGAELVGEGRPIVGESVMGPVGPAENDQRGLADTGEVDDCGAAWGH
jgi:hypothetical protein